MNPPRAVGPSHDGGPLAAFGVTSFRFQFGADLLTAWAIEMEALILGWYVLVETDSALALAVLGSLRFGGTLLTPLIGSYADRFDRRRLLIGIRLCFAVLAATLATLALDDRVAPWHAFAVVALSGLLRPADMMLRQSLVADTVPGEVLVSAVGFSRTTLDSARVVGALAGAGLMAVVGIGWGYVVVTAFYLASSALCLGIRGSRQRTPVGPSRPVADLLDGMRFIRTVPLIQTLLWLAFLVNLTVLSITGGLLPVVARDVYGLDETGLGMMMAAFAGGALVGSLLIATVMRRLRSESMLRAGLLVWHLLMIGFAQITSPGPGIAILAAIGLTSSFVMVPMASCLIVAIPSSYRGRVMGVRQLAVFGLPIGLLAGGALTEALGVVWAFSLYGGVGLAVGLWVHLCWDHLTAPTSGSEHRESSREMPFP